MGLCLSDSLRKKTWSSGLGFWVAHGTTNRHRIQPLTPSVVRAMMYTVGWVVPACNRHCCCSQGDSGDHAGAARLVMVLAVVLHRAAAGAVARVVKALVVVPVLMTAG